VLLAVMILKLIAEVALLALVGRALVGLLAGPGRQGNPFWRLFDWAVAPLERPLARWSPRHAGAWLAAALLLLWLVATTLKIRWCLALGLQACRPG
jgi:hypothetical protein